MFPVSWVEAIFGPDSDAFPCMLLPLLLEEAGDGNKHNKPPNGTGTAADALLLNNKGENNN